MVGLRLQEEIRVEAVRIAPGLPEVVPGLPEVAPGLPQFRAIKKVEKHPLIWLSFYTVSLSLTVTGLSWST